MKRFPPSLRSIARKMIMAVRTARIGRSISSCLPENPIKFLIVSEPRSGSNLLCGIVNSHPQVLCFYEMFHRQAIYYGPINDTLYDFGTLATRNRDPVAFVAKIYSPELGYEAVGFKMFNGHNNDVLTALVKHPGIKKIILRRSAALHAFTSLVIARQTNDYISMAGKPLTSSKKIKINLDVKSFKNYVDSRDAFHKRIKRLSGNQQVLEIDYTDIVNRTNRFQSLPAFIGVEASASLKAITRKQNPDGLEDRVMNLEEIRNSLAGTKYEHYLKEELY